MGRYRFNRTVSDDTLEPGYVVHLQLSENGRDLTANHPPGGTYTLLLGSQTVPMQEERLVGQQVGETGKVEVHQTDDGETLVSPPTELDELLSTDQANRIRYAGVDDS
jgi:hypothetical protein